MAGVRNPNTEDWTPARVAKLRELKSRNYSASQIAKALGGTTRSAVISKLHQQGLTRDAIKAEGASMMSHSPNPGVKTKALAFDLSPPELLRPRRFSWEDATP
jgi:GcrA cell cycle regulator